MLCRHSFGKPKRQILKFSDFTKFYSFVLNRLNKAALSESINISRTSLWRRFKPFFGYSPDSIKSFFLLRNKYSGKDKNIWVIGIDGKWLRRKGVIMLYRDVTNKINLYWSFHYSESYEAIETDFNQLKLIINNDLPSGIITDWKGAIVSSVNRYLPNIPHQRCLTHVKRSLMGFLPTKSPILATRELRLIAQRIILITNEKDKILWKKDISDWINKYDKLLKEKTIGKKTKRKWWYTHGNLRRAIKLLNFDEKCLFAYLNYSFLPKTNNSLEGLNSQIKTKLSNHRGLKIHLRVIFIFWLLTFYRVKNKKDFKELWDSLKTKICRN